MTTVASTEKFSYSLDGELYEGDYSSFAEAASAAREAAADEKCRNGEAQEAWVGRLELTPLTDFIDGESILDGIDSKISEHIGDRENQDSLLSELLVPCPGRLGELNRQASIGQFEEHVAAWISNYIHTDLWVLASYEKINLDTEG